MTETKVVFLTARDPDQPKETAQDVIRCYNFLRDKFNLLKDSEKHHLYLKNLEL